MKKKMRKITHFSRNCRKSAQSTIGQYSQWKGIDFGQLINGILVNMTKTHLKDYLLKKT